MNHATCPDHPNQALVYYDGMLGFESLYCPICGYYVLPGISGPEGTGRDISYIRDPQPGSIKKEDALAKVRELIDREASRRAVAMLILQIEGSGLIGNDTAYRLTACLAMDQANAIPVLGMLTKELGAA